MITNAQTTTKPEPDRLSHAKNFANELSESRLREIAETYRRRWTPEARAIKSKLIQSVKPWLHATGPKTPSGKFFSSHNTDMTKDLSLATRFSVDAIKIHARFLTRLNKLLRYRRYGIACESLMKSVEEEGLHVTARLILARALWRLEYAATPCP